MATKWTDVSATVGKATVRQLNTFQKLFYLQRWIHLQYLAGFSRPGSISIAVGPAPSTLPTHLPSAAPSYLLNQHSETPQVHSRWQSVLYVIMSLHAPKPHRLTHYLLYYLKIHANTTFLCVKWKRTHRSCWVTHFGVSTHFWMWARQKSARNKNWQLWQK